MHLSECFDGQEDTSPCHVILYHWFFKTTTEFFQYDLQLNYLFGLLCFSYSLSGCVMLLLKPKWVTKTTFPYTSFALLFIFVQGPLSFSADYLNMTNDSIIHVIDRFMAVINTTLQSLRITLFYLYARPRIFILNLMAFIFAIFSFMKSQDSQQSHDVEGFIFWHNMWHCCPLLGIMIDVYDYLSTQSCEFNTNYHPISFREICSNISSYMLPSTLLRRISTTQFKKRPHHKHD